jgi:hypothetical protein
MAECNEMTEPTQSAYYAGNELWNRLARGNGPSDIDECRKLFSDFEQRAAAASAARAAELEAALRQIEAANEELCAKRSSATYQSLLNDGAEGELSALDDARRNARQALAGELK